MNDLFTSQQALKLHLQKPIVFFDLETTGVNTATDRIVEYSFLKVFPDGTREEMTGRLNPTIPIPPGASKVHGINDEDVTHEPTFAEMADELNNFLEGCDLAGYNSNKFDVPLLVEEFLRHEVDFEIEGRKLVDIQNIFHKMEQRTLAAAVKFYCNRELENAHSASADNFATFDILEAQLEKYPNLTNDVSFLHEFSAMNDNVDLSGRMVYDAEKREVFNFGKHKGRLVSEVFQNEASYYSWMMKGEFPLSTKRELKKLWEKYR